MGSYTIGEVARLARVSIRTLHHYDEIGLLRPSGRTAAGYRQYTDDDLARLQQVLFHRELGFPLDEIRQILSNPAFDRQAALTRQRALIRERMERLQSMLMLVDDSLEALAKGENMNAKELFGDFNPSDYEAEVEERWGDTDAYKESSRRTKSYGKAEWTQIRDEADAINRDFVTLLDGGVAAGDARAQAVAERHRLHLERWFYPCSSAMHRGLGDMYVADPRFTRHYDDLRPRLAQYVRDAIHANAGDRPPGG